MPRLAAALADAVAACPSREIQTHSSRNSAISLPSTPTILVLSSSLSSERFGLVTIGQPRHVRGPIVGLGLFLLVCICENFVVGFLPVWLEEGSPTRLLLLLLGVGLGARVESVRHLVQGRWLGRRLEGSVLCCAVLCCDMLSWSWGRLCVSTLLRL